MQPGLGEGLERDMKTVFTIVAGEVESPEGSYGSANLEKTQGELNEM